MPPGIFSRHLYTIGISPDDADLIIPGLNDVWPGRSNVLHLTGREPFTYRDLADNILHDVVQGDSVWSIAAKHYRQFDRPSDLWWIIADFQPIPIIDPSIELVVGSLIVVPSTRTIREEVFSESRANGDPTL